MRILFMGTPDFAATCLQKLIDDGFDVCAAISQPDKPKGRGHKLQPTPVKEVALAAGIPVYQPEKLRDGMAEALVRSLAPDLIAVVAYGRIIPDEILAVPPLGAINIHGSVLPKYRGAAPIQWTVINGESTGGVTCAYLTTELDSGDIIAIMETPVSKDETSGELFSRLSKLGAELLSKTAGDIASGVFKRVPQDHSRATSAPQLTKEMGIIDFSKSPQDITNLVRGLDPWPVARTDINGKRLKVFSAEPSCDGTTAADGTLLSAGSDGIKIACGGGRVVVITEIQSEGGKRMPVSEYLRGNCL